MNQSMPVGLLVKLTQVITVYNSNCETLRKIQEVLVD